MRVLLIAQYFKPETVGAAIWIHQLAVDLRQDGNEVTVVTGFPNIPDGVVFDDYRRKLFQREFIDGVEVIRTYLFASRSREFWPKLLNFASFSASAGVGGLVARRPDVIYAILPPLPLGVTANILGSLKGAPVIINVQDIWPHAAVAAGLLRNRRLIRLFEYMEAIVYRQAHAVVVISESFRQKLLEKGVPAIKVEVVPNWADPDQIRPLPRENKFRRDLGAEAHQLVVLYSGTMSHNSCLETIIDAAHLLRREPILFMIVGDGVKKRDIEDRVAQHRLDNVRFFPFQPLDIYPEILAAADISIVALHREFSFASVPSKTFKIMASRRPILALASEESEVCRIVQESQGGFCVPPDDVEATADILCDAIRRRSELDEIGANGRRYLQKNFSRKRIVGQIESLMQKAIAEWNGKTNH